MTDAQPLRGGVHLNAGFGTTLGQARREVAPSPRFDLLIIGPFGGRDGQLHDISTDDIAEALAGHGAVVAAEVENHLGSEPPMLAIEAPLRALRDLDPATLSARVPVLLRAGAIASEVQRNGPRAALDDEARSPRFDTLMAELAPRPSAPPAKPAATPSETHSLDHLLSMVELPAAPSADPARSALSAFIGAAASPRPAPTAASAPLGAVERQRAAIAASPEWRRIEAAWRGLRLILSQRGRNTRPRIRLWDAAPETLAGALDSEAFLAALTEGAEGPHWGAILVLGGISASARDLEALRRLALLGYAAQIPVIVSLKPDFFGAPAESAAAMDNPAALLEGPAHAAWRGLRGRPESQFLFAAWNDVLLRQAGDGDSALWGEAGLVVAAQLVASLERTGWPTEITGSASALSGLELAEVAARGGRSAAIALRALIDPGLARDLAADGLICAVARPDRDEAWLARAACVHLYELPQEQRAAVEPFASLPFRCVSGLLETVCRDVLERHSDEAAASAAIQQALDDLLQTSGAGAQIAVTPRRPESGAGTAFEIAVTLGRDVMGGFSFSFDLER